MATTTNCDENGDVRRRQMRPGKNPSGHRYDGTSPLPLCMDWRPSPFIRPMDWRPSPNISKGKESVWPTHDSHQGWSYCVRISSLTSIPSSCGFSNTLLYGVEVIIKSPQGTSTTLSGITRYYKEFLKLYSELKKEYPKENLPSAPPRRLIKTISMKAMRKRMHALDSWMANLLSDIDVSRSAHVAIFLELEAAARQACRNYLNQNASHINNSRASETSDPTTEGLQTTNNLVSLSDVIDVLETSGSQIGLPLAEARVRAQDAETSSGAANEDDELRKSLGDILVENSKLSKQVKSLTIRGNTLEENAQE